MAFPRSTLVLSAVLASCAPAITQERMDASLAAMDTSFSAAARAASESAPGDLKRLALPVRDHLSAVQYCSFMIRHINATDPTPLKEARARAGWLDSKDQPPEDASAAIDWGALFPSLRMPPGYFPKSASAASGPKVYYDAEVGVCALLSTNDAGADERTLAWLASPASGWKERRQPKGSPWRLFMLRDPNIFTDNLAVFHAVLPDAAKRAGISSADVVVMIGLP